MKIVELGLIGAGDRGNGYGGYALDHPDKVRFIAVAEPDKEKRNKFAGKHGIPEEFRFESWEEMLSSQQLCSAVLICTRDRLHYEPAVTAMKKGYNVLVEKPMSYDIKECLKMGKLENKYKRMLMVCHVLRYTVFFSTIKKLIQDNRIGDVISIQHNENVGYWHQAHSFVRGNWRNSKTSCPMILAKSCHDMDILRWLMEEKCVKLSSFGSLSYFRKENAPKGSGDRCINGCRVEKECPYSALKIYLGENTGWPVSVISPDTSMEARRKALEQGPYGRCVFRCDNNVVDHQVVSLEFENHATASFTMCAFNKGSRTIKIMGTCGEIRGDFDKNELEINSFKNDKNEIISTVPETVSGHGGGDFALMEHFVNQLAAGKKEGLTSAKVSVDSHLMAFAAEEARLTDKVISLKEFEKKYDNR